MESRDLLIVVVFMCMFVAEIQVHGMSAVNTDFEQYLRSMNSSTTVPKIEERQENFIFAWLNYTYDGDKFKNFTEEKARYGEGQILSVQGPLVHVTKNGYPNDDLACSSDIVGTQGKPIPRHTPWIALVRRGICNFEEKVNHVYQKGAIGVIIYNDKLVTSLEKMKITNKTRNITAVITYKDIGEEMISILNQGYEVVAAITRGKSGVRPINTLNKTSVLFVSISFIVLMIISLVWLIFYYIQRFRYLQSKDQQSRHLCSVTKRAIMKIPTKTGKSNDKDSDSDCCAICIEAYKSSDCIRVLPCNHEFHKTCIDPWLIEHRTCPMCKLDVLKYYGYVVGEPSTTISSSTNERIINPNVHIVIAPSSTNSSQFGGNDSSNHSTDSSQPASVVMIGRASPATVEASAPSDSSLMLGANSSSGGGVATASTASRQVTDV